jgi:hypothetical protein
MINEIPKYPVVRPEIRSEIKAIDALLYDFILKIQESARELDQTAIVLNNYLDICESVRDKLLGLTDCEPHTCPALLPAPPTITDLPADQQRLIFEAAMFGAVALKTLIMFTHADGEYLINTLSEGVNIALSETTEQQITEKLHYYLELHKTNLVKQVFSLMVQSEND